MSVFIERKKAPRGMIGPRVTSLSRILRSRFNQVANEEGLFSGQQHIIILIKENDGLSVSQIANALKIAPATVSVSVKRMEKAGFVIRKPDENDARITKLYLTEKGKAAPDNIKKKMDEQEKYITNGMSAGEKEMFSDLLDRAINNMQKKEDGLID